MAGSVSQCSRPDQIAFGYMQSRRRCFVQARRSKCFHHICHHLTSPQVNSFLGSLKSLLLSMDSDEVVAGEAGSGYCLLDCHSMVHMDLAMLILDCSPSSAGICPSAHRHSSSLSDRQCNRSLNILVGPWQGLGPLQVPLLVLQSTKDKNISLRTER